MIYEFFVFGTFWFWALLTFEFFFLIFHLGKENYRYCTFTLFVTILGLILFGDLRVVCSWIYHNPLQTLGLFGGYLCFGAVYSVFKWWFFVHDIRDENRDIKKEWLADWRNMAQAFKCELDRIDQNIAVLPAVIPEGERKNNYSTKINNKWFNLYDEMDQIKIEKQKIKTEMDCWTNSQGIMTADLLPLWKKYELSQTFYDWFGQCLSIQKPLPENFKARIIAWIAYWPPSLFWTILNDPLRRLGKQIYRSISNTLKKISDKAWKDEDNV